MLKEASHGAWWYRQLRKSGDNHGIIVMRCGDFKTQLSSPWVPNAVKQAASVRCQLWLRLIHGARVLHRDLRVQNIVWFGKSALKYDGIAECNPYRHREDQCGEHEFTESKAGDWQIVDFNLACECEGEGEMVAETLLNKESGQFRSAGVGVSNADISRPYPWRIRDDLEMLSCAMSKTYDRVKVVSKK